jgi:hypothetical protein
LRNAECKKKYLSRTGKTESPIPPPCEERRRDTDTETPYKKGSQRAPFFVGLFKFRGLF